MAGQITCSSCQTAKDNDQFPPLPEDEEAPSERTCNACLAETERLRQEDQQREQQEAARRAQAQQEQEAERATKRRLYACEDGHWRECILIQLNEDGTATILKALGQNSYSDQFPISCAKMQDWDEDQVGKRHNQRDNASDGGQHSQQIADIFANTLQQIVANSQLANSQNNNQESSTAVVEKLYLSNQMTKFKAKFPTDEDKLYRWIGAMTAYQSRHSRVPSDMLFDRIRNDGLTGNNSREWQLYRERKYEAYLVDEGIADDANERSTFMKDHVDNVAELQKFAITFLQVEPDISKFQKSRRRCPRNGTHSELRLMIRTTPQRPRQCTTLW